MRKYNLPIFIPHRGCPHDCAFCSQKKITGIETEVTKDDVRVLIKKFLSTIDGEDSLVEVAFFGGSFTGLPMPLQKEFLEVVAEFFPKVSGVRLSTRPDCINDAGLDLLKRYNVTMIELGVQSSDDEVLKMNNRGHDFESVVRASRLIREKGIGLGHQMMLGMYGSTPEKDKKTVKDIIALSPDCVRIYPVLTLKGTAIEKYYNAGFYKPYSLEEAALLAKDAVVSFREANIDVIRLGLHASEELDDGETVVAGPYHPAFGEIVEGLIFRDKIEKQLLENGTKDGKIEFLCQKGDVSKVIGHKKSNKIYFKEQYNLELCALVKP